MTDEFDRLLDESDQPASRLISEMKTEADQSHFEELAEPAVQLGARGQRVVQWRPRAAAAIAASVALLAGFSGVAWAAQGADPGDTLYGLDRALEAVGIGDGGAAERLDEAKSLVARSQLNRGLQHAADAFSDHPSTHSAVSAAADRAAELDVSSVLDEVSMLLDYLSATPAGSIDGEVVAGLARAIGPEAPPVDVPGPPSDVPPVDVPGPPSDVPPVDVPPVDVPGPPSDVPPVDVPLP